MKSKEKVNENGEMIQKNKYIKFFRTIKSKIILAVSIIFIIILSLLGAKFFNREATADFSYLNVLLEKSSELTTAKLKIRGIERYKDAGVVVINRSDFIMVYSATIRAGVDLKNVKIEPNTITKEVVVKLPKAKVFDSHVDQTDIQYFDEKLALFNVNSKEDANKACALAEEDAIKEAEATGILEFAEKEAEYVIKDILTSALPEGYTLVVKSSGK